MPRKKQYVAMRSYKADGYNWSKGKLVLLEEAEAYAYVAQHFLLPLDTAIREGLYDPTKHTLGDKVKTALFGDKEEKKVETDSYAKTEPKKDIQQNETKSDEANEKKVLGNKLRDAVQEKKAEQKESEAKKVDEDKLAAIKSGGKK